MKIRTLPLVGVALVLTQFAFNAFAQSSSTGCDVTTTITMNTDEPIILNTNRECLQINTGVSVSAPFDAIQTFAQDVQITNAGSVTGNTGLFTNIGSSLSQITNLGSIDSNATGIYHGGELIDLNNSGLIRGGYSGLYVDAGAIQNLNNSGTISSGSTGIIISDSNASPPFGGLINRITNTGTISGDYIGIFNLGRVGELSNSGQIISFDLSAVINQQTINALVNQASGVITGQDGGIYNYQTGSLITSLSNFGLIRGNTSVGIQNDGTIGTLANSGTISGQGVGIYNFGSTSAITSLSNFGSIRGDASSGIQNAGTLGSLTNESGADITGGGSGIVNESTTSLITSLVNSGAIVGNANQGIDNSGTISTLTNNVDAVISGNGSGIFNNGPASVITNLTNSGEILGGAGYYGIDNDGTITALTNQSSGVIVGNSAGIYNRSTGTISSIQNQGTIEGSFYAIGNSGTIGSIQNSGLITSPFSTGIGNNGRINILSNTGSIYGLRHGVNNLGGVIGELNNSGAISAGNFGFGIMNSGTIVTLNNLDTGTIAVGSNGYGGVFNGSGGIIQTLNNSGTISAGFGDTHGIGIYNEEDYGLGAGIIQTLNNSGTIRAVGFGGSGIVNLGTIGTLTNSGDIYGDERSIGVGNNGTISTLINSGLISVGNNPITPIDERTGYSTGIGNSGTISNLLNSGTILVKDIRGIGIFNSGDINILTNTNHVSVDNYGYGGIYNEVNGSITILNNSGTVSAGDYGSGIHNRGTIATLNNSGTISTGMDGFGIYNGGVINTLTNTGTIAGNIYVTCDGGTGDCNSISKGSGRINTLNNSGTISGDVFLGMDAPTPGALPSIGTLNNSGSIDRVYLQYMVGQGVAIENLNNSGQIRNGISIVLVASDALAGIGRLTNSGSIDGGVELGAIGNVNGLSGAGIQTFINTGTVTGGINIHNVYDFGTPQSGIELLTNMGSITGGITVSSIFGNSIGIKTLNNAQGGNGSSPASTALTYQGMLPTNYNVIIGSANQYGQLAISDPGGSTIANFGIYGTPFITARTYAGVLSGTTLPTGTSSGTYDNMTWSLVENGSAIDLAFTGASLIGTQQSLVNTVSVLQGTYTLQNSVMVNGFTYDCALFDQRGICVSAGGRNTTVQAQGINNTSGLLIASYRLNQNNSRIGAWVDQNLSVSGPGTVQLGNSTPMVGLFGVWSQRPDGIGAELKVSAAYGQKNTTITRQIVGLSEPGSGSSQLISQGAQAVAKYGFAVLPDVVVSPYAGIRYTQNNMGGYTEATSPTVTAPLTYAALNTNATTALAGAEARYRGIPKTTLFASAGVETDTNTSNGTYSATGITGLTPVNFNPNPVKTRPTATLGGYYDILKNQRIGVTGIYRQEPFQAVSTTTVLLTYTIGL